MKTEIAIDCAGTNRRRHRQPLILWALWSLLVGCTLSAALAQGGGPSIGYADPAEIHYTWSDFMQVISGVFGLLLILEVVLLGLLARALDARNAALILGALGVVTLALQVTAVLFLGDPFHPHRHY